jgi:hypothetical protein
LIAKIETICITAKWGVHLQISFLHKEESGVAAPVPIIFVSFAPKIAMDHHNQKKRE